MMHLPAEILKDFLVRHVQIIMTYHTTHNCVVLLGNSKQVTIIFWVLGPAMCQKIYGSQN